MTQSKQDTIDFRNAATTELSGLLDRLTAAADAATKTAREQAAADARTAFDQIEAKRAEVQRALEQETAAREALEKTHAALAEQHAATEEERDTLRALADEVDAIRGDLQSKLDEAVRTRRDVQTKLEDALRGRRDVQAKLDEAVSGRRDLQARLDEAASGRREIQAKLDEAAQARRDLKTKLDEALHGRQDAQARLDDALRGASDAAARSKEWRVEQGRAMRDHAVTFVSSALDHVLAMSARFASVSTEDDVLGAVVDALASEFTRVALFRMTHSRLDVVRHVGFAFPDDPTRLVVPQAIDAVLAHTVTSGQVALLGKETLAEMHDTPFGGTAACALALPIDLDDDKYAVAYADDADQPHQAFADPELRRKFAVLLRQIAMPLLVRLPAQEKAIAELGDYAAMLVGELENLYAADVAAHRKGIELRRRLQDNLACARDIYAQRVLSEPAAAATLLEARLAALVSRTSNTPFGRDLAKLVGAGDAIAAQA